MQYKRDFYIEGDKEYNPLFSPKELELLSSLVPGKFPDWKNGQLEAVNKIQQSENRIIALRANTGFGKSAIYIATALLNPNARCVATSQTIQLGDQYFRDFSEEPFNLKTVKGRSNFKCTIIPSRGADTAPCCSGMKCPYQSGGCDYYEQKIDAVNSSIVSMNIQYFLTEVNYGKQFSGIDILFLDEAHKLESALKQFIEIRLSKARFKDMGAPVPQKISLENLIAWKEDIVDDLKSELSGLNDRIEISVRNGNPNDIIIERARALKSIVSNLDNLSMVDSSWIFLQDEGSVTLKPIYVSKYSERFIFRHARKIILMSATLPQAILKNIGVKEYEYITIPSTFSPQNRPIFAIPAANLGKSAKNPELEKKKLLAAINVILKKYPGKKGIIHTVNYSLNKFISQEVSKNYPVFTHENSKGRLDALAQFEESRQGVLVSPSFSEGLDLPYDGCRFQIIAKIPYLNLGDKQISKRMENDKDWYNTETILTLQQTYGRIMRAEDDSGDTYILDSGLLRLIKDGRKTFDELEYFLDALFIYDMDNNSYKLFSEYEQSLKE